MEMNVSLKINVSLTVRVYCNRSQKTSQRVKNNCHSTPLDFVSCRTFCSLHAVTSCDLLQYTRCTE